MHCLRHSYVTHLIEAGYWCQHSEAGTVQDRPSSRAKPSREYGSQVAKPGVVTYTRTMPIPLSPMVHLSSVLYQMSPSRLLPQPAVAGVRQVVSLWVEVLDAVSIRCCFVLAKEWGPRQSRPDRSSPAATVGGTRRYAPG